MGEAASGVPGGADPRRGRVRAVGSSVLTPPTGIPKLADLGVAVPAARAVDLAPPIVVDPCVCGHARAAHDHYRPGWDCVMCGASACADYRAEGGGMRRILRWAGLSG